MSLWRPKLDPFFKDILNKPGISVEPDIFLGNLNQLLVDIDTNHPSGLVVLRNTKGKEQEVKHVFKTQNSSANLMVM